MPTVSKTVPSPHAMAATAQTRQLVGKKIEKLASWINSWIKKGPLDYVIKHLAKWIALAIVIMILIYVFSPKPKPKQRPSAYDDGTGGQYSFTDTLYNFGSSLTGWGSPFGIKASTGMDRAEEKEGRCDDIENVTTTTETIDGKTTAFCLNSNIKRPTSIRWAINLNNLYEYDLLPSAIKKQIENDTGKITNNILYITIPYVSESDSNISYKLSCKDAKYNDGTSAAELFKSDENDTYCKLNTRTLNSYTSKVRAVRSSSQFQSLDRYV